MARTPTPSTKRAATARPRSDAGPPDLDAALDALRAQGHRITTARRAVIQALLRAEHGLTTGEIAAAIEATQPDTHLSTVYRTLEALEEAGVVVHIHGASGGVAYQLADRPHQSAECDTCGLVIELPVDILDGVARELRASHDFELDTGHFPLLGRCADCRAEAGSSPHRH
jgi:Fur family ferric uptake transcriptional regulator